MIRTQRSGLSLLLLFFLSLSALAALSRRPDRLWIEGMIALAGVESLAGFWLLSGAMTRSHRFFYSAFAGGMLSRLSLLGAAAYVLHRWAPSAAAPLITLVIAYFISSLIQIPFLMKMPPWTSSKS